MKREIIILEELDASSDSSCEPTSSAAASSKATAAVD
jgi:hypothetical protein